MRKLILASAAAAIATLAGGGVNAQTATRATTGISTAPAPKALSATGRIVSFDDSSKTLTLSTAKGEEKFVLGSSARLQEGAKTITAANLSVWRAIRRRSATRVRAATRLPSP